MADITVKKNDGVTNITYTAKVPAGGDGTAAIWRSESVGTAPAHFPELRFSARDVRKGLARAPRTTFVYPMTSTNSTTGVTSVVDKIRIGSDWDIPKNVTQAAIDEAVSQYANLLAAALTVSCLKAGYAPT